MDRKFIYLFTLLLCYLCQPSTAFAGEMDFPFSGGTTSDGIVISDVLMKGFNKSNGIDRIQVVKGDRKSTMSFSITVPDGQTAELSYKVLLHIKASDQETLDLCSVSFMARIDDQQARSFIGTHRIEEDSVKISIPAGSHKVSLEAIFNVVENCVTGGNISKVRIHVHKFNNVQLTKEPICGETGTQRVSCVVCKRESDITFSSKFPAHILKTYPAQKGSCLDNIGEVKVCENCPYMEIKHAQQLQDHDFDTNGTCKVCHLHMPKSNADGSVYEINDAGEMRILSEMVSAGRIPGNIGVDIKADLVFGTVPMLPLGTFTNPFRGVLNGNGHRISGVTNCYQGYDGLGFVGVAKGTVSAHTVIANLIFDGGNTMKGAAFVGGIAGYASFCDIYNCASFGILEGTDNVGGIVGFADQQVSIVNCGSATTIKTAGKWNPMVCNMPMGHILNSYGAATNLRGGTLDELTTADVRHCFSSHGSTKGITRITQDVLSSYDMRQWLSEESESIPFTTSEKDIYLVPVVNTTIVARSNGPVLTNPNLLARRAASASDYDTEKGEEIEVLRGYVDDNASIPLGKTVEEVMRADISDYPGYKCLYVVTRSAPEGFDLYDKISGGDLLGFESYRIPADSSNIRKREYDIVATGRVKPVAEAVYDLAGAYERIDEYSITDGDYTLKSCISFENQYNIVYQENVNGRMKTVWTIETEYDKQGNPTVTNVFSHNYTTGEIHLDYSYNHNGEGDNGNTEEGIYEEYFDNETNTVHIIYNYLDSVTGQVDTRDHYIVRASDEYLLEYRTERMKGGQPCLLDGSYYLYDDEGCLSQVVSFGPVDVNVPGGAVCPYMYDEYVGYLKPNQFPTAIQVPEVKQPSLQKHMDSNVYDSQGRVVRIVTDAKDPFSGLPHGLYIYQGNKYLVRN